MITTEHGFSLKSCFTKYCVHQTFLYKEIILDKDKFPKISKVREKHIFYILRKKRTKDFLGKKNIVRDFRFFCGGMIFSNLFLYNSD